MDDLGSQEAHFNVEAEETKIANLEWKKLKNTEEINRAKSSDEGAFLQDKHFIEAKAVSDDNQEFEFNTTAVPGRSETLELIKPVMSPRQRKKSDAESFLIKPNGVKTNSSAGGSIGSNGGLRFNIAIMGDKGSGKTSLI